VETLVSDTCGKSFAWAAVTNAADKISGNSIVVLTFTVLSFIARVLMSQG
jgi:hypothetical protein